MRWWPRSLRWQMLAGLVLLEVLSIGLFVALLVRQQAHEVHDRMMHRLAHQATSMALQSNEALEQQRNTVEGGAPGAGRAGRCGHERTHG